MKMIEGCGRARLREQVAHARGADADDRLDELRRRDREERGVRLAGDRAREQRLAGARARPRAARRAASARRGGRSARGSCRKSTISVSSALASSIPATSAKVTRIFCGSTRRARERPNWPSAPIPPPAAARAARSARRCRRSAASGRSRAGSRPAARCVAVVDLALISTFLEVSSASSWLPFQNAGTWVANSVVGVAVFEPGRVDAPWS